MLRDVEHMSKSGKVETKRDPKKESIFKELAQKLAESGVIVRRERLKQGPGWKVLSGSCQVTESNYLFVDSRLSQDEQLELLSNRLAHLNRQVA